MRSGLLLLADSRLPSGGHGHSGGVEALVDRGLLRSEADLAAFLAGRIATGAAVPAAAAAAACALAGATHDVRAGPSDADVVPGGAACALAGATDDVRAGPSDADVVPGAAAALPRAADAQPRAGGHVSATLCVAEWAAWDHAVSARLPAAATRVASYAQGAALLRTAARAWPSPSVAALRTLRRVHHPLVLGVACAAAGATPSDAGELAVHHLVGGACTAAVRLLGLDPLAVAAVAAAAGRRAEPVVAGAVRAGVAAAAARDPALLPADGNPLFDVLAQLHRSTEATLFAS
jgi:urease accessory protein